VGLYLPFLEFNFNRLQDAEHEAVSISLIPDILERPPVY
jgi:hypothetical protein